MNIWEKFRRWATRALSSGSFSEVFTRGRNVSGERVTPTSVLGLSAAYSCVRLISDGVATLPADVFLRVGNSRVESEVRPDWLDTPNPALPWHGPIEFRSQVMLSLLLDGNAYVLTPRDEDGKVVGLAVLDPARCDVDEFGTYTVDGNKVGPEVLMHIRGMVLPGCHKGVSPVTYAREMFGMNLAAQKYGAAFYGNSAHPSVVITAPGSLSKEGQEAIRTSFIEKHGGTAKAHGVALLTEGAAINKLSFSPEDAQFLQSREFGAVEVASMFGVPPHLIGHATKSTSWGPGIAQQNVGFQQWVLRSWVERIDAALTLLWQSEGAPRNGFIKLNMDAGLRASAKERYEAYAIATGGQPWMTVNEVRLLEDRQPIDGGNVLTLPTSKPEPPPVDNEQDEETEGGSSDAA